MRRRLFLQRIATPAVLLAPPFAGAVRRALAADPREPWITAEQAADWRTRWEKEILGSTRTRYCDKETGEELGWLVSPFLEGFYQGYLATRDAEWVARLVEWMDACVRRATKEPDGFPGWPKGDGGGDESTEFSADSLLGEAMMLRPAVLMADTILKTPALAARFGDAAHAYIKLAEDIFQKWDTRNSWRSVKDGGLWIVPAFGIDRQTGQWSSGYAQRATTGFSNPANKENHIARWLIALFDVTRKPVYRERAEGWWRLMRSRLRAREDGKFYVWNYWDPAGPWDYKPDGSPKHWVGVHPNGGYYGIDVESMVTAFEHGLVFNGDDLARLIRTNRDFMWNQQVTGARFQRIDGGQPDPRWKNSPGVLWTGLIPYDATLRKIFVANHDPVSWGGIAATPWFLARAAAAAGANSTT